MGWLQRALSAAAVDLEVLMRFVLEPSSDTPFLDLKLLIGIGMWGGIWCYWLYHKDEHIAVRQAVVSKYWAKAVMVLGLDLAALSLLQQFQTRGFLGVLSMVMLNVHYTQVLFNSPDIAEPAVGETRTVDVKSLYEDVLSDLTQVITVFITQTVLFLYLFYASFVTYTDSSSVTYGFFVTAYQVQMSAIFQRGADGVLGPTWNIQRFRGMMDINSNVQYQEGHNLWGSVPQWKMRLRMVMGFTVNTILRDLIAFLTPIVLMQSDDAMDFVQNCLAVSYITQLDDLSEGRSLVQRLIPGLPPRASLVVPLVA